jgi:hypothetical protein
VLHRPQVEDFLDAIIEGREPLVGIEACRQALQLTAGIYKSAMTGEHVDLPLAPDDPWYRELPAAGASLGTQNARRGTEGR